MRPTHALRWGWLYRQNNVPHFQRLFQRHDGVRQWYKTPRSKLMLYPFFVLLYGTFASTMYAMVRLTLGHKTWYGKG